MESFTLLKYWKTTSTKPTTTTTTIDAAGDGDNGGVDDGPFFDLEFAIPADNDNEENGEIDENEGHGGDEDEDDEEQVEETNLTLLSPSDEMFIKGRILEIDGSDDTIVNSVNKTAQFPIPVSLAKSATKFRVFLHGLKRSKSESNPRIKSQPPQNNKKFFTVNFNVDDVPIFSLLTRASSNSKSNSTAENDGEESCGGGGGGGEEKRNKKEVVQKYLKMVKVKVSKRKESKKGTEMKEKDKMVGPGLNLKVIVKKHLGKSKSSLVHSMVQQQNTNNNINNNNNNNNGSTTSSKKRDDSLLQQQDGIQSAILHCKRSFNSSKDFLEGEEASSVLLTQLENESLLNEKKSAIVVEEGNDDVKA